MARIWAELSGWARAQMLNSKFWRSQGFCFIIIIWTKILLSLPYSIKEEEKQLSSRQKIQNEKTWQNQPPTTLTFTNFSFWQLFPGPKLESLDMFVIFTCVYVLSILKSSDFNDFLSVFVVSTHKQHIFLFQIITSKWTLEVCSFLGLIEQRLSRKKKF